MAKSKAMALTTDGGMQATPEATARRDARLETDAKTLGNYNNILDSLTGSLTDIVKADETLTDLDSSIAKLQENKDEAKKPKLERLTAIRDAMARRRQILSTANTGR
jgi:hypothetical protein